jgi:hypothetical protein
LLLYFALSLPPLVASLSFQVRGTPASGSIETEDVRGQLERVHSTMASSMDVNTRTRPSLTQPPLSAKPAAISETSGRADYTTLVIFKE